jgi:hypothetical protein
VKSLVKDDDAEVRHVVARRLPSRMIVESLRLNIDDDELNLIYQTKKMREAAEHKQQTKLTGDVIKQDDYPDLSE